MNIHNQILKDDRNLNFCTFGNPNGEPVFYFHGFPSSFLEPKQCGLDKTAEELNINLITANRPGYGDSEFHKNRKLLDWPDDICELADSLGIKKFSVLGYSGGGPYALACAQKIPNRLNKVVVVSGMGPASAPGIKDVPSWMLVKWPGFILNIVLGGMKKMVENNPDKFLSSVNKSLPKVDMETFEKQNFKNEFVAVLKEAFKTGIKGAKQDAKIYKQNWGFELENIQHQVFVWHGEKDANVKIETAKYIAVKLPNYISNYYEKEGHLSLISNKSKEIFEIFLNS